MFTANPFAALARSVSPAAMQGFVIAMIALVVLGTLYDMQHKKSATYFFANWRRADRHAKRSVGGGERIALALRTAAIDWLTSGEFCNARRRIAHLLTMYGFLAYAGATLVLVFAWPAGPVVPLLWHLGALMICLGGYWFWFFIRVDVAAEGHSPFRIVQADLFVLSLLASATLALFWSALERAESPWAWLFLGLYLAANLILFGSVPWSKFSHMFFKPAAAFQKRVEDAGGARRNMPAPADKPEIFGSARRQPHHY